MTHEFPDDETRQTLNRARKTALEALAAARTDSVQARRACDEALALALPLGLTAALADILRWNGTLHRDAGLLGAAESLFHHSLSVATAAAYPAGRAHALNCLGGLAQLRGDLDGADDLYQRAGRVATELDDRHLWALVEQNRGIIAGDQGRADDAAIHFRQALAALQGAGETPAVMWLLNNLGVLHRREGLPHRALRDLQRAHRLALQLEDVRSEVNIDENLAAVYLMLGDVAAADRSAARAYEIADARHDAIRLAAALLATAAVRHRRSEAVEQTIALLEQAVNLIDANEDASLLADVLLELGDRYRDAARTEDAQVAWDRAKWLAQRSGFRIILEAVTVRQRQRMSTPTRARESVNSLDPLAP